MLKLYSVGERQAPCGTPLVSGKGVPVILPILTDAVLSWRKLDMDFKRQGCSGNCESLNLSPLCQTLSKAFDTSLSTMSVVCLLLMCEASDS